MEHLSELAIALVGLGLTGLGIGFTIWSRRVDDARDSLDRVAESIREVVKIRLDGISSDVHIIRQDLHEFTKQQNQHAIDIARLKERHQI